jgi:3-hydroxyisobutyrate dehydrogenase-like beta-hydroxyacid dehydrogenase
LFLAETSQKYRSSRQPSTTNLRTANLLKEIGDTCDMAIICVKDYQAVVNVSFSSGGIIETKNSDLIVIQCSTISPEESSSIADLYSKKQIRMLSVPMLGGTTAMERGEIPLIGAGQKMTYDLAEPILKDLSTQIFYVGSDHRTKYT